MSPKEDVSIINQFQPILNSETQVLQYMLVIVIEGPVTGLGHSWLTFNIQHGHQTESTKNFQSSPSHGCFPNADDTCHSTFRLKHMAIYSKTYLD
ncbi:hypothetical protein PM082_018862 [Marasmius tenuissimus]|nr:hypothetical protein PM082_018862 [Marasmius tenuissimus]